jgi:hypothetical protein
VGLRQLTFLINAPIIKTIIDDLFFCDDEQFHKFEDEESNEDVVEMITMKAK